MMAVQLRVGGKYLNGKGEVVGPLSLNTGKEDFCFVDNETGRTHKINGKWSIGSRPHPLDLVEEIARKTTNQMQVQTLDNQWVDAVDHGERRDGLIGMYYTDMMTGIRQHGWFRSDHIREKPIKQIHRTVRYVNLYRNGGVSNTMYVTKEQACSAGPNAVEQREVSLEWESE